uniref:protein ROOT HAIR DEFECTIVE 3-like n=1 Tax=Erigeron canadensis TaxID=72917 RepID=UPI001CB8E0B6|nr:protein ROOT HAIR DEFECTIVE 3-like [Erigeron canadensis]
MMAGNETECYSTQLIDGDGTFNGDGLDRFIKQVKLGECGLSYAVVAIMGPQHSGKSTLINHLFDTNFKEMDTMAQRSQTTKGIWIARCVGIEPCTIVMDLEGTDGRERGEDDTVFEKQSALFALVVADKVIINMWCQDIGREHAANKPLLRAVFSVMLRLFRVDKKTLMFVIRDKSLTPFEHLKNDLSEGIEKIWNSVSKPESHKDTRLKDLFNVEVVALSNFELQKAIFKEEVASLKQKFFQSIAPAGDRREVVPASGFSISAQQIWKLIKENKDLDLPSLRVMVATLRCDAIVTQKYSTFIANKAWLDLQEAVETDLVEDFGEKVSLMISNCLSGYDHEATYFEASVTSEKRKQLEENLLQLVQPAYQSTLKRIQAMLFENFKDEFSIALNGGQGFAVNACDYTKKFVRLFAERCERAVVEHANWDLDKIKEKFSRDLNSHITEVQLVELSKVHESNLKEALHGPVKSLLEMGSDHTWPAIRELLQHETETAVSEFSSALLTFEIDEQKKEDMISKLKNHARGLVEKTAREEAGNALHHMKERFTSIFKYNGDNMPRVWSGKKNIQDIAKTAWSASLKFLSVLAAIRLDDTTDTIWDTLVYTLLERTENVTTSHDSLSSFKWKGVPVTKTLIAPLECNELWIEFLKEACDAVAKATIERSEAKKNEKKEFLSNVSQNLSNVSQILEIVQNIFKTVSELADTSKHISSVSSELFGDG